MAERSTIDVEPRIIKLLANNAIFKQISRENDPALRLDGVNEILQNELMDESETLVELKKIDKEMDASVDINNIWGRSLDLLGLQIELSREACSIAGISTINTRSYLLETIIRIYGRGCHVASEVFIFSEVDIQMALKPDGALYMSLRYVLCL